MRALGTSSRLEELGMWLESNLSDEALILPNICVEFEATVLLVAFSISILDVTAITSFVSISGEISLLEMYSNFLFICY